MNAIEKGFSLGDAEKSRLVAKGEPVEENRAEANAQKDRKNAETKDVLEKARAKLTQLSEEKKQQLASAYLKSSAGVILRGESNPEKILNHPRAGAGFAAFLLKEH